MTAASSPVTVGKNKRSITGAIGGFMESWQTSRTKRSTESRRSRGIPTISRVLSSTPNTKTPPRLLANAANSSAKALRSGAVIRLPENRTSLYSRNVSSPSRILSSSSLRLSYIGQVRSQPTVATFKRFPPAFHYATNLFPYVLLLQRSRFLDIALPPIEVQHVQHL